MSLVEHVFNRPADDRNIPFADIASSCDRDLDKVIINIAVLKLQVEVLIMRALSLGLVRGTIDEVDGTFTVTWVQPRILNKEQIAHLNQKLVDWGEKVKSAVRVMESGITSELGS
jgi:26S proteasome regulatory subunit N9